MLYVKDLQARLAAHVHMLIRLPEETWRVKLDLDRSVHMRGKRVESCFVECLRGTLAPGGGRAWTSVWSATSTNTPA